MRFFSKLVAICNICFILAVILRLVEISMRKAGNYDGALKYQPLEATVVVLGYGAIFLNVIFVLFSFYWLLTKKIQLISRWIVLFNIILFPLQVYFFFFS